MRKKLGHKEAFAEGVGLGCILLIAFLLVGVIYAGITTGRYAIIIEAPYMEAYLELLMVIAGLIWYIKYRRIKFTLHPQWQRDKNFSGLILQQKKVIQYEGKEMV